MSGIDYFNELNLKEYRALDIKSAAEYVKKQQLKEIFGSDEELIAEDISDGNLNLVFRVKSKNSSRSVILKQGLPYVRRVGESWPLTPVRILVEMKALQIHGEIYKEGIPEVYHTDPAMFLIIMEDLHPAKTLRDCLIEGEYISDIGVNIGRYLGRVMAYTSDFFLDITAKRRNISLFLNPDLVKITEDLVLTNPYHPEGWGNRMEAMEYPEVRALQNDVEFLSKIAALRDKFNNYPQALIHGDLHSGSIMAGDNLCKAIDLEFATYGPIGFDIGNIIGSLLINWIAQEGLTDQPYQCRQYRMYIMQMIEDIWDTFREEIYNAWLNIDKRRWPSPYLEKILKDIWEDAMGYSGTEMIRRTIGLGYIADLKNIEDVQKRRLADKKVLSLALKIIKEPGDIYKLKEYLKEL
ncbi:5'-methylthioribose kinase [Thermosyntropha lipolytica DSM 11003]|uniref:S-methyl-5-thioribose kinase n=1 Tax=Thermosyntropha lipolytica DSM 11003 TaxID=1123382 RepID=A0A1M5QHP8_9FIRM|nr:S-methyl-5-thioribose kinase [Thermosyntropha lipolytica]SHH13330.1 5'-methylthioribose kinase [Thermosyntropha lipolytica DSM 11003]